MKQQELERLLQGIPPHPKPDARLEQYATPAPIAADLLYRALGAGDVADRRVLDLGCGTGILGIGAALLGAIGVEGVDVDASAIAIAEKHARKLGVAAEWRLSRIPGFRTVADTVVMNPPFGAQRREADRPFLETALECAPAVYSLHLAETEPFVRRFVAGLGGEVTAAWRYSFPLSWRFPWHDKPVERIEVVGVRIEKRR